MSDIFGRSAPTIPARADMAVDAGLRGFMLGVFNKMGLALAISGALAWVVGTNETLALTLLTGPLGMVVRFAPIVILLISAFTMRNPSPLGANLIFWSVTSLIGISLGAVVIVYGGGMTRDGQLVDISGLMVVAESFLITAATFGALALWGYTTKRDLTGFGVFLFMALIGLILASLVNMFVHSSALGFAISAIGVLIFAGLTAWDTQRLKFMYFNLGGDTRAMSVATTYGALSLYLDFINMFLFILRLMGSSRN